MEGEDHRCGDHDAAEEPLLDGLHVAEHGGRALAEGEAEGDQDESVAAVGIILRGASYALRGQLDGAPRRRLVENVFALSSVLTPFAPGTVVGAVASGRVPVGNARGDLVASWLNPTSVLIGALAVATSSYLAAVYLAADARRVGERTLEPDFRARALWAGIVAGALAIAGLAVVRFDGGPIWDGLTAPDAPLPGDVLPLVRVDEEIREG